MMLPNATAILMKLPKKRSQNPLLPITGCLKNFRSTNLSINVFRAAAIRIVASQVPGLNVPILKTLYMTMPGNTSQTIPAMGISKIPKTVEAAFMATSANAALENDKSVIARTKKNSTTNPTRMAHQVRIRPSNRRAGQTTSAKNVEYNCW